MIASPFIAEWSQFVSWAAVEQVEQDLTLSRLIVEIANDDFLGNELVFRGGTCLHKLHLPPGLRYSEDLDYVRRSAGGIREMVDALRSIGERLGMRVNVDVTKFPRVRFRAPFESGTGVMRIKIEINTYERSPARPLIHVPFAVESQWFHGSAMVQTFEVAELVSTKLRALYQRSKGRDLFDLWLALTRLAIPPTEILTCFEPYRPEIHKVACRRESPCKTQQHRLSTRPRLARQHPAAGLRHGLSRSARDRRASQPTGMIVARHPALKRSTAASTTESVAIHTSTARRSPGHGLWPSRGRPSTPRPRAAGQPSKNAPRLTTPRPVRSSARPSAGSSTSPDLRSANLSLVNPHPKRGVGRVRGREAGRRCSCAATRRPQGW